MTNEGKAKQLVQKWAVEDYAEASTYFASCEMAEWKDKQFVKELCKVLEFSASPVDMEDEINNLIQKYENQ